MVDVVDPTEEYSAARYAPRGRGRDPRHHRARPAADSGRRHRVLLSRAHARPVRRAGPGRAAATAAGAGRGAARARSAAPVAGASGSAVGGAYPAARRQAPGARAGGLAADRPAADGAFRRDGVAAPGVRRHGDRAADSARGDRRARRAGAWTRSSRRACSTKMRGLLARGVPETALPFSGLVYRQALEHLHGVRDEAATRELIVRENRQYARRQLIWFRKEPNLRWIHAAGERRGDAGRSRRASSLTPPRP